MAPPRDIFHDAKVPLERVNGQRMTLGDVSNVVEDAETGARRYFDRSLELYRAGRYRDALEQLKRAAELDPFDSAAHR